MAEAKAAPLQPGFPMRIITFRKNGDGPDPIREEHVVETPHARRRVWRKYRRNPDSCGIAEQGI